MNFSYLSPIIFPPLITSPPLNNLSTYYNRSQTYTRSVLCIQNNVGFVLPH